MAYHIVHEGIAVKTAALLYLVLCRLDKSGGRGIGLPASASAAGALTAVAHDNRVAKLRAGKLPENPVVLKTIEYTFPSMTMPPPTPVPSVIVTEYFVPLAAPATLSAFAAALASFSMYTLLSVPRS